MEKRPAISVVIPVYNTEKYIRKCLDSVISSTFPDIEIICIDDGSSDHSLEILREYSQRDPRIRILTQDHQYAGAARNAGIDAASGKYIHFLDSDDEIFPEAYEKLYETAEANQAEVCECLYINTDAATGEVISRPNFLKYDQDKLLPLKNASQNAFSLIYGHVIPWNKLYLREFLTGSSIYFDDLICAEDRSFYFNVIFHAKKIIRIPDRLMNHRLNIKTSLDGSDIRLQHFDVEFRSFENIMDISRDATKIIKAMLLRACMIDSLYFYSVSLGTKYEENVRNQMCDYWRPYLFRIENEDVLKQFEKLYGEAAKDISSGLRRRIHLFLTRHCIRGHRYFSKFSAPGRRFAYRTLKKLRVLFKEYSH